jgi:hypothetical protein
LEEEIMFLDERKSAQPTDGGNAQPSFGSQEDAEAYFADLLAYYQDQRKRARSNEWAACLDATIRQLRGA